MQLAGWDDHEHEEAKEMAQRQEAVLLEAVKRVAPGR